MADPIVIKRGNTRPEVRVQIRYQTAGASSAGLADATGIVFRMADAETAALKVEGVASVSDPATGEVVYQWTTEDTNEVGKYLGEFAVTYSDGRVETFPSRGGIPIEITPRVDDEAGRSC